jgi:hypothetical protein
VPGRNEEDLNLKSRKLLVCGFSINVLLSPFAASAAKGENALSGQK